MNAVAVIAEEALRALDFDTALAGFAGSDPDAVGGRVRTLWAMRRYDDALELLGTADHDHPATRLAQGVIALGRRDDPIHLGIQFGSSGRDSAAAIEHFTAAHSLGVPARRGLAMAHRLEWRLDEARAILREDEHPSLTVELAWCLVDEWDLAGALALLSELDDTEALFATASIAREAEAFDTAATALDELTRRNANGVQTRIERASLAEDSLSLVPAESVAATRGEIHKEFVAVLELDPTSVRAAECAYTTDGSRRFDLRGRAADSPRLHTLLAFDKVKSDAETALADARTARSADPHLLLGVLAECGALQELRRLNEAREVLEDARARCPKYVWMQAELGWLELSAGRHEKALGHFEEAGRPGMVGVVNTLRLSGCAELAERRATELIRESPGDTELLGAYGLCAFDEHRYRTASGRLRAALQTDPGHREARRWLRQARWRRVVSLGWFDLAEWAWTDADDSRRRVERWLPAVPPRLRARLRELDRRVVLASAVRKADAGAVPAAMVVPIVIAAFVVPSLFRALLGRPTAVPDGVVMFLMMIVAGALIFGLVWTLETDRSIVRGLSVVSFLTAVGLGWLIAQYGGQPGLARYLGLFALTALALTLLAAWSTAVVLLAVDWLASAIESRARRRTPIAGLVHDLTELLELLDYPQWLIEHSVRARCLELLESAATGLGRALREPIVRSARTRPGADEFGAMIAESVAAVRGLKRLVVRPTEYGWDRLREVVRDMAVIACEGRWGDLPRQQPEPKVLRNRLLVWLRGMLIVLVPPLVLAGYQLVTGRGVPTELSVVLYVVWPLLSLMWWLDPNLSNKIATLKSTTEVGRPPK